MPTPPPPGGGRIPAGPPLRHRARHGHRPLVALPYVRGRPGRRLLLLVAVLLSSSCSPYRRVTTSLPAIPPAGPRLAREVRLATDTDTVSGKIAGLRGDTVAFAPTPYWRAGVRTFRLEDIAAIEVEEPGNTDKGFLYGFGAGFTFVGLLAGSSATYDEDYSAALSGAAVLGLAAGVLGAILTDAGGTTTYDLARMPIDQRRVLVSRLTARESSAPPEEGTWSPEGGRR